MKSSKDNQRYFVGQKVQDGVDGSAGTRLRSNGSSRTKQNDGDGNGYHGISSELLETPGFLLSQTGRLIREQIAAALKPTGISGQELAIMRLLADGISLSQQVIGAKSNLDKTTITELVDELESKGYARRQVSAHDRRSKEISLTASGKRMLTRAERLASAVEQDFTDLLSEREWNTIRKCLIRYIETHKD
jgi:DNA-binding MarR family transcriptional regulator